MRIHLICVGKTDEQYLLRGIEKYQARLKHYVNFRLTVIPDVKSTKNLSAQELRRREAVLIAKHIKPQDWLVLLDENGTEFTSAEFAHYLEKTALQGVQQLVFVIGGPYGLDVTLAASCKKKISLSRMTFSHQMVRLFFVEQLYRAFTIQRGEPYHHS